MTSASFLPSNLLKTFLFNNAKNLINVRQRGFPRPINPYSNVPVASKNAQRTRVFRRFGFGNRRMMRNSRNGMEINRAEGGFKNLNQGGKRILRSINIFLEFTLNQNGDYCIDGVQSKLLNIYLVNSTEFNNWRLVSYKYKPLGVNISIDYNTSVPVQIGLNKLILSIETSLLSGEYPNVNATSMQLNMSRMGVKNFNFRFNSGNMNKEDIGPFPSLRTVLPDVRLRLSSQMPNYNPDSNSYRLGVFKISYLVAFWLIDRTDSLAIARFPLPTNNAKILEMKVEKGERFELVPLGGHIPSKAQETVSDDKRESVSDSRKLLLVEDEKEVQNNDSEHMKVAKEAKYKDIKPNLNIINLGHVNAADRPQKKSHCVQSKYHSADPPKNDSKIESSDQSFDVAAYFDDLVAGLNEYEN